jgi:hypothetical protein
MANIRFKSPGYEAWKAKQDLKEAARQAALAQAKTAVITNNMFKIAYESGITYANRILDNPSIRDVYLAQVILTLASEGEGNYSAQEAFDKWVNSKDIVNSSINAIGAIRDEPMLAKAELSRLEKNLSDAKNRTGMYARASASTLPATIAKIESDIVNAKGRVNNSLSLATKTPQVNIDACLEANEFIGDVVRSVIDLARATLTAFNAASPVLNSIVSGFNDAEKQVAVYFNQEKEKQTA